MAFTETDLQNLSNDITSAIKDSINSLRAEIVKGNSNVVGAIKNNFDNPISNTNSDNHSFNFSHGGYSNGIEGFFNSIVQRDRMKEEKRIDGISNEYKKSIIDALSKNDGDLTLEQKQIFSKLNTTLDEYKNTLKSKGIMDENGNFKKDDFNYSKELKANVDRLTKEDKDKTREILDEKATKLNGIAKMTDGISTVLLDLYKIFGELRSIEIEYTKSIRLRQYNINKINEIDTRRVKYDYATQSLSNRLDLQLGGVTETAYNQSTANRNYSYSTKEVAIQKAREEESQKVFRVQQDLNKRQRKTEAIIDGSKGAVGGFVGAGVGAAILGAGVAATATGIGAIAGAVLMLTGGIISIIHKNRMAAMQASQEEFDKKWEIESEIMKMNLEYEKKKQEIYQKAAQKIEKITMESQQSATHAAIAYGQLSDTGMNQMRERIMATTRNNATMYGFGVNDVSDWMKAYTSNSGRNVMFSGQDINKMAQMDYITGEKGFSAKAAADLNIFNKGPEEGVKLLEEAYSNANKMGLNGLKIVKTITENLKLAQQYNFKNGTQGLMDMAVWAEKTRFNMSNIGQVVDKVIGNGIEDVIKQSAELNVLGGNAAIYSNPFGMLFDALQDPAALAKRYNNMINGFGSFNRKNGETTFSNRETLQMKAIANSTGQDYASVRNQAIQKNKVSELERLNYRNKFGDKLENVANNAVYKNGRWSTSVWDSNKQDYVSKDIDLLTKEDLSHLLPEDNMENISKNTNTIVDILTQEKGVQMNKELKWASAELTNVQQQFIERRLRQANVINGKSYYTDKKNIEKQMRDATNAYGGQFSSIMGMVDAEESTQYLSNIDKTLSDTRGSIISGFLGVLEVMDKKGGQRYKSRLSSELSAMEAPTEVKYGVQDSVIPSNGKSRVIPVQDSFIKTNPLDDIITAPLGKIFDNVSKNKSEITVNGSLLVKDDGGRKINILDILNENPNLKLELYNMIFADRNSATRGVAPNDSHSIKPFAKY